MAIDTAPKRIAMLNFAGPPAVQVRLIEPDGAVDKIDRFHFLKIYGGIDAAVTRTYRVFTST